MVEGYNRKEVNKTKKIIIKETTFLNCGLKIKTKKPTPNTINNFKHV